MKLNDIVNSINDRLYLNKSLYTTEGVLYCPVETELSLSKMYRIRDLYQRGVINEQ